MYWGLQMDHVDRTIVRFARSDEQRFYQCSVVVEAIQPLDKTNVARRPKNMKRFELVEWLC